MMHLRVLLLACTFLTLVTAQMSTCPSKNTATIKVSINSRRNVTGHWISQIGFNHEASSFPYEPKGESQWRAEVESSITRCKKNESNLNIMLTLTAAPPKAFPGYELFPDVGYYKFHPEVETWPRALEVCAEEGAHLAVINSEKETDVLKKIFARYPKIEGAGHNDWAWIGAYEAAHGGQYYTIFGDDVNSTGFARWGSGQPSIVGSQAYLLVSRTSGGLGDTWRTVKDAFFCEQEIF